MTQIDNRNKTVTEKHNYRTVTTERLAPVLALPLTEMVMLGTTLLSLLLSRKDEKKRT